MAVDRCATGKVIQLAVAGGWGSLPRWGWGRAESGGFAWHGCRCGPGYGWGRPSADVVLLLAGVTRL